MRLSAERWQALIPYLDQALDLPVEQSLEWLAALREKDAGLAEERCCSRSMSGSSTRASSS